MRKAIIYHSVTNTVEKCAKMLKEEIQDIDIIDIKSIEQEPIRLCDYDFVIFGGALYYGAFSSKIRKYVKKNQNSMKTRGYAFFGCCVLEDKFREILNKNLGEQITSNAVAIECFGYEIKPQEARGFEKLILKIVEKAFAKEQKPLVHLEEDRIKKFAQVLKNEWEK